MVDNTALYSALAELQVVDRKLLDEVWEEARESGDPLSELLLERDLISDENLGLLVADMLKVPFIRLEKNVLNREILQIIPEEMARARRCLVFKVDNEGTHIAMEDPTDLATISLLKNKISGPIKIYYATERDIKFALFAYRREASEVFEEMINRHVGEAKSQPEPEAPIIRIVGMMIIYAYQSRASDIHIEPYEDYIQVRFRIDGVLQDVIRLPLDLLNQIVSRIKIMSSLPTDEHSMALDGKFVFTVPDVEDVDVRVSIIPSTTGERIVMRLLAGNMRQYALLDLGFSDEDIKKVREAYSKPYGMLLSTGPTGSGKTTTMYAFIKILNRRNVNIMTIEDPVEYQMRGVNQIQVNAKTNLTFAAGLKSIVRQDPNIILVGEIRDEETANIAVNAALTGHLVLSTLHTNDAATTIPRLLEMKVEPFLVASSVNMIVAQRLVRKICTSCRVSKVINLEELIKELPEKEVIQHLEKEAEGMRVYYGKGCGVCRHTGYVGRIGIFEVMPVTEDIRKAIVDKSDAEVIKKIAISEGMQTMLENGLDKVKLGLTTVEELLRVIKGS
ncbi:MAG TPA: GspE/PulE family protein [Patescibacteria group bacterium]